MTKRGGQVGRGCCIGFTEWQPPGEFAYWKHFGTETISQNARLRAEILEPGLFRLFEPSLYFLPPFVAGFVRKTASVLLGLARECFSGSANPLQRCVQKWKRFRPWDHRREIFLQAFPDCFERIRGVATYANQLLGGRTNTPSHRFQLGTVLPQADHRR